MDCIRIGGCVAGLTRYRINLLRMLFKPRTPWASSFSSGKTHTHAEALRNADSCHSFDYAGNGPWPASAVINYMKQYGPNSAHMTYNGKPIATT